MGFEETLDLLNDLYDENKEVRADLERRFLSWNDGDESRVLELSPLFPREEFREWGIWEDSTTIRYVIALLRAGSASLGYFENGELVAHKVVRKYMVRMKQGKSQLSYLKTKGKSRAGSRIRLRESEEFFEEVNEKLSDWFTEYSEPELIFLSMPVTFKSYFFSSDPKPPFNKDDSRIQNVPYHVHQPDHEELLRVHKLLSSSTLKDHEESE